MTHKDRAPMWEAVRDYIDVRGLKREYVAAQSGIKPARLSLILNGHRRMTIDDFRDICIAIDADPNRFFGNKPA